MAVTSVSAVAQSVTIGLQSKNQKGEPTTVFSLNEVATLEAWVQDTRPNPLGIVSIYFDLEYDKEALIRDAPLVFGDHFGEITSGTVTTPGIIDEVGSFARGYLTVPPLPDPLGGDPVLLFSTAFIPTSTGVTKLTTHPAGILPRHATTLHGIDDAVSADLISYGSLELIFVPEPSGALFLTTGCLGFAMCSRRNSKR